jgi:RecA/RadA recombinase
MVPVCCSWRDLPSLPSVPRRDVTFGNPETTTDGNALKFYASMRLDVRRIGQVTIGDELVGGRTRVKMATNKCGATNC